MSQAGEPSVKKYKPMVRPSFDLVDYGEQSEPTPPQADTPRVVRELVGRETGEADSKYGTSFLRAARRVYRYLSMMEQALVLSRIKRTPDFQLFGRWHADWYWP